MIEPADRRVPISPQLAVRVASLGTIAFILFGIIFFRLWFLQVLSGDQFLAEASKNRVREQPVPAPRGEIVDRSGNVLVRNRKAIVLRLDTRQLPEEERELAAEWGDKAVARSEKPKGKRGDPVPIPAPPAELAARFARMGRATGLSVAQIQRRVVIGLYQEPLIPTILTEDVTPAVRQYVAEYKKDFPGLEYKSVYLREYPYKTVAAQLFGQLGEITKDQLGTARYKGVRLGSVIGQNGLERTYDQYLRGTDGIEQIFVNAANRPIGARETKAPRPGRQLRTTLDLKLQQVGQAALSRAGAGKPGAFLAMNPDNGEVLAMGSAPTFDPNELVGTLTETRVKQLFGDDSGAPLTNRAVQSLYPTGSTFKPVTAFAGIAEGVITPQRIVQDSGVINLFPKEGESGRRQNAGAEAFGAVDLRKALSVSSDIYFYVTGLATSNAGRQKALQTWARKLGFGRLTGIDTGGEAVGVVPSRKWRDDLNQREADCRKGTEYPSGAKKPKGAGCGIADGTNRPYSSGDDVNLAIGQGDLQATPLQVALSYAAIATGGTIPTPHIGTAVEDENGEPIQEFPKESRKVKLPAEGLATIRAGLHDAASQPGGTSADVFAGWPQDKFPIFGKTGTAQTSKGDQSWYAAYVRPANPTKKHGPLLVVGTVERGGFGAEAAAPMVRQILSQYYEGKAGDFKAGSDATR